MSFTSLEFYEFYKQPFVECFNADHNIIKSIYEEDTFDGYPVTPGGSAWDSELKFLYCIIRLIKPKKIIEIGNWRGHSANHILLACENNNNNAIVDLVDIEENIQYENLLNRNFNRHLCDSLDFIKSEKYQGYDLIVQDGNHEYEYVKEELELILNKNHQPFYVWSHDYFVDARKSYVGVKRAWDTVENKFDKFYALKDDVSDCGFVFAGKGI